MMMEIWSVSMVIEQWNLQPASQVRSTSHYLKTGFRKVAWWDSLADEITFKPCFFCRMYTPDWFCMKLQHLYWTHTHSQERSCCGYVPFGFTLEDVWSVSETGFVKDWKAWSISIGWIFQESMGLMFHLTLEDVHPIIDSRILLCRMHTLCSSLTENLTIRLAYVECTLRERSGCVICVCGINTPREIT